MNADDLIQHALAKPEPNESERLHLDDDQLSRIERVRVAIHRLVDDGMDYEAPPDLARRTITFVARNRRRPKTWLDHVPRTVPFRWADFAVAASIFVAGTLTLLPAIQRSRERMNQAGCVFNLQQLGSSLAQYATLQRFLPHPPAQRTDTHAGMFAVMLHDAGVLPDVKVLDCPCNGACPHLPRELASYEQVEKIRRTSPAQYERMLGWDYAYNVGYRHASGHLVPMEVMHASQVPMIADQPNHDDFRTIREGNSLNHGGRGQNVLFGDGSVRWYYSRMIGPHDPDMFLNNDQEPRPGTHPLDSVLVPSKVPFDGR
jgi:prepilin-type processing-associated H-X9-DG protein